MITNEIQEIEELKKNKGKISRGKEINLYKAIWLLAKEQVLLGKDRVQAVEDVESWLMQSKISAYDEINSYETINEICGKAVKYKTLPIVIEDVKITKKELDVITSLNSKPLERLAFGYLVNAKINNKKNQKNDSYVSKPTGKLFRELNMRSYSSDKQEEMVGKLIQLGLLELGNIAYDDLSNKILFIDEDIEEYEIKIEHFDDYIFHYDNYIGEGDFKQCERCGKIIKKASKYANTRYCQDCKSIVDLENSRRSSETYRQK